MKKLFLPLLLVALALSLSTTQINAATVWSGALLTFAEVSGASPTLATNQDRLTSHDWLTRGSVQGLYNASTESGFSHFLSPADTQWADGTLANFNTLVYHDWNTWAKSIHGGPGGTVGVNAVLHLVTDDIYLSIKFTSWGAGGSGGFSYQRTTPSVVPEPATLALLGLGLPALLAFRRRKS